MKIQGSGPDDLFDSARLKWGHAVVHGEAPKADIIGWIGTKPDEGVQLSVASQYDAKRHGFALWIEELPAMPIRWGLMIGDVAFNFRSCLDQIAWAFVERGNTPSFTIRQERLVSFPIYDTPKLFRDNLAGRLPGVRRADIALVRKCQPHVGGVSRVQKHLFSALATINNADKHGTVQPLGLRPTNIAHRVVEKRDCLPHLGTRPTWREMLDVNADVGFIRARKLGPNPELRVESDIASEPAFHRSLGYFDWFDRSKRLTCALLSRLSDPPEELFTFGLDLSGLPPSRA